VREVEGEEVEDFGDPKWEPEPVDAAPGMIPLPKVAWALMWVFGWIL
jgi:hypothetical protein